MKRSSIAVLLAVVLAFAACGPVLASPPTVGGEGQVFVFGDYAPFVLLHPFDFFEVGIGYNLSENFALGVQYQFRPGDTGAFGGFANLSFDPILINGELVYCDDEWLGKVAGLFALDLDPISLALGGGAIFAEGDVLFLVEGMGNIALGDNVSLYGGVDYVISRDWLTYKAGLSFGF